MEDFLDAQVPISHISALPFLTASWCVDSLSSTRMGMLLGFLVSMMVDPVTNKAYECVRRLAVGHGGPGCARYVRDNLLNNLLDHPRFVSDLNLAVGAILCFPTLSAFSSAVERAYINTDKKYLSTSLSYKDDG